MRPARRLRSGVERGARVPEPDEGQAETPRRRDAETPSRRDAETPRRPPPCSNIRISSYRVPSRASSKIVLAVAILGEIGAHRGEADPQANVIPVFSQTDQPARYSFKVSAEHPEDPSA